MKTALISLLFLAFLTSCSSSEKVDISTATGAYKRAQSLAKAERYDEAITVYSDLKNKFPYNKLAISAELEVANIHYKREAYVEAESSYKIFREFHPKHPLIDFVTFRIGMSIYKQLPRSIDRDLSLATNAIFYFEEVVRSYPKSDYAGSAGDHKIKCLQKLARKEDYIGNFYFVREKYDSALNRYEDLIRTYPNVGLDAKSLYRATYSANKLNEVEKFEKYLAALIKFHPNSKWTSKAKNDFK